MAKKKTEDEGVNKSAEIRTYLGVNPTAKPKQVVAALAEKGISVTPAFVSTLKSNDSRKAGSGNKPGRRSNGVKGTELLVAAKKFADQAGGVESAQEALAILAKILS